MSRRFNPSSSMIVEEHRTRRGIQIGVKENGGKLVRPDEVGINQLKNESAQNAFMFWLDTWSDIQGHLQFLYEQAQGDILELGTRGGISTSAFLYGVERKGGHVWSVDFNPECAHAFEGHPKWTFVTSDSLAHGTIMREGKAPSLFDVIFIDTEHTYQRLSRELAFWFPRLNYDGILLMHDILSAPEMAKAAEEYAAANKLFYEVRPGSNGLGILKKR